MTSFFIQLVRQVVFHIGEIRELSSKKSLQKLWTSGIEYDKCFMDEFRNALIEALDRVREVSKNENEFLIYLEIRFKLFGADGSMLSYCLWLG
jgi:hypothetical protein